MLNKLKDKSKFLVKTILSKIPESIRITVYPIFRGRPIVNILKPKNFNDFINTLKLSQRSQYMVDLQDKVLSKELVARKCSEIRIPGTLAVYKNADEFKMNRPSRPYVLKTNNGCGLNKVVVNESDEPEEILINNFFKLVNLPYGIAAGEWTYQHIKPAVFAEEFLYCEGGLHDYKVYVIKGEPRLILVCMDRGSDMTYAYYDENWCKLNLGKKNINNSKIVNKPVRLEKMLHAARSISEGLDFCRVDFYVVKDEIYFGEVCFYPEGGYIVFEPHDFNKELYESAVVSSRPFSEKYYP